MGDDRDDKAVAALLEGAIDKVQEAEAAMATAASMIRYAITELISPKVAGLDDPVLPA